MATLAPDVDADDQLERVRTERDHWRAMFESIVADYPELILVVNAEGVLTHWNDESAALTGVSATDAVGTSAHEIAGVDEGESTIAEQVTRRAGERAGGRNRHHGRTSGRRTRSGRQRPVTTESGNDGEPRQLGELDSVTAGR